MEMGKFKSITSAISVGIVAIGLSIASSANAALVTFNLAWVGTDPVASATGKLTIDDIIFGEPRVSTFETALTLGITAFEITVNDPVAIAGTFSLTDFDRFIFDTGGLTLDPTQQLIGQAVGGGIWGQTIGNFNFLATNGGDPTASIFPFDIVVGAEGDEIGLRLTSITTVPLPASLPLFGFGLVALAGLWRRQTARQRA